MNPNEFTSRKKTMLKIIKYICPLIGFVFFSEAKSACQAVTTPVHVRTVNIGNISTNPDTPIGTQIGSKDVPGDLVQTFVCQGVSPLSYAMTYLGGEASGVLPNVYKTNLPGVGISATSYSDNDGDTWYYSSPPFIRTRTWVVEMPVFSAAANIKIKLFKIGDITPGTLAASELARVTTIDGKTGFILNLSGGGINPMTCLVRTPNINVTLPTISAGSFTSIGKTLGDTNFTVGLQCDANTRINAAMNFTQDSDTSNQSVAAVSGKGSAGIASGVGIQLLYGSIPLNNNTLTFLKTSSGGQEFPDGAFTARYFQTKSSVLPGNANATATMTLTYQ